jgi:hypothetical protein
MAYLTYTANTIILPVSQLFYSLTGKGDFSAKVWNLGVKTNSVVIGF